MKFVYPYLVPPSTFGTGYLVLIREAVTVGDSATFYLTDDETETGMPLIDTSTIIELNFYINTQPLISRTIFPPILAKSGVFSPDDLEVTVTLEQLLNGAYVPTATGTPVFMRVGGRPL